MLQIKSNPVKYCAHANRATVAAAPARLPCVHNARTPIVRSLLPSSVLEVNHHADSVKLSVGLSRKQWLNRIVLYMMNCYIGIFRFYFNRLILHKCDV